MKKAITLHLYDDSSPAEKALLRKSRAIKINPDYIITFSETGPFLKKPCDPSIGLVPCIANLGDPDPNQQYIEQCNSYKDEVTKNLSSINLSLDNIGDYCTTIELSTGRIINVIENLNFVETAYDNAIQ